jgi:hypothetical protein
MNRQQFPQRSTPKKSRGCLFSVLIFCVLSLLFCCCLSGLLASVDDPSSTPEKFNPFEVIIGQKNNLGTALTPPGLSQERVQQYDFRQSMTRFELGYGLSQELRDEAQLHLRQLADGYNYQRTTGNRFNWNPPSDCTVSPWFCIYRDVGADNQNNITALASLFREYQNQHQLDDAQLVELVMSFVQTIPYRLPTESPFGILPPALVLTDGSGDCDSKSLLGAMVLEELGVDCAMLYSETLEHAALGVAIPATGQWFSSNGKKYYYVESTATGWPIGKIPPEYNKPKLWQVIEFGM